MGEVVLTDRNAHAVLELHDPSEHQWTPTLRGDGGGSGQVYAKQRGVFLKIGRLVHVSAYVALTTRGTFIGNVCLFGLPFDLDLSAEPLMRPPAQVWFGDLGRNHVWVGGQVVAESPTTERIALFGMRNAGKTPDPLVQADIDDATVLQISAWYPTPQ